MKQIIYFRILEIIRKLKYSKFICFIVAILISLLILKNQLNWLENNCTNSRYSPSCDMKTMRIYFIPIISFFMFYVFLFLDKIYFIFKKKFEKLEQLPDKPVFIISAVISTLLAVLIFYIRFSFLILNPKETLWLNSSDWLQNYLGGYVFQSIPWQFPFGVNNLLNYPIGTSMGYSDSIPILAFLFKILKPIWNPEYQYLGLWLFICYILQGFFSALLLKKWNMHIILKIMCSFFLFLSPVLLNRFGHITLNCHWIILAIFCIFLSRISSNIKLFYLTLILLFSVWIHPYITLMVIVFYFMFLLNMIFLKEIYLKYAFMNIIGVCFFTYFSWYLIGYFHIKGIYDSGFGIYSSNLNSFFNPLTTNASQFINPLFTPSDKFEGFGYLGLGILILTIPLFFQRNYNIKQFFDKKYFYLNFSVFLLFLFSLLPIIKFFDFTIFAIKFPEFILNIFGTFRSNGRYIWPMCYLIVLYVLLKWVLSNRSLSKKIIILSILLFIQLWDIYPLYKRILFQSGNISYDEDSIKNWVTFVGNKKNIVFYPTSADIAYKEFWYLSAKYGYTTSVGYFSRNDDIFLKKNEQIILKIISDGNFDKNSVYYVLKGQKYLFKNIEDNKNFTCQEIGSYYACKLVDD